MLIVTYIIDDTVRILITESWLPFMIVNEEWPELGWVNVIRPEMFHNGLWSFQYDFSVWHQSLLSKSIQVGEYVCKYYYDTLCLHALLCSIVVFSLYHIDDNVIRTNHRC